MISPEAVAAAEYIVRTSGALQILSEGLRRDGRGRKSNDKNLELLLIGLLLSIQDRGKATVQGAYRVLTQELPLEEQLRIGSRRPGKGDGIPIKAHDLYNQAERLSFHLAYGPLSTPQLDDAERERRRGVVLGFSNAVMDAFDLGWDADTFALDATGIWSWARGGKRRAVLNQDEYDGEDSATIAELMDSCVNGEVVGHKSSADRIEDPGTQAGEAEITDIRSRRRRALLAVRQDGTKSSKDDGLGYTTSFDPDADWGVKTAKSGDRESFFGYHEHTLVMAPATRIKDDPSAIPPLIRRLEVTRASEDVVDVSLRLIDSMPTPIEHLLVDSHYHYKTTSRWLGPLTKRKVKQHHDLRRDEQGFTDYERIRFAAGAPHCPATPGALGTIQRPAPNASKRAKDAFRAEITRRAAYAMRMVNQPAADGAFRCECPALDGRVGCPLRPGTIEAAIIKGRPVIEDPPDEARDGEPLPPCCTQDTRLVRPPEKIRKLQQRYYWGSETWESMFRRRTYVEGSYGGRKNVSTENLRRGLFQRAGLPWAGIVSSLVAASYNLRLLQNWHARSGQGDPKHALFNVYAGSRHWRYMDEDDRDRVMALYEETLPVQPESLEAA